jgi:hypothetical protein
VEPFKFAFDKIADTFERLGPVFDRIGAAAAPIVPLLADTFDSFVSRIIPAIEKSMPNVVKMFEVLADRAPGLADAFADLIETLSEPQAVDAFNGLLGITEGLIRGIGKAVGFLTLAFVGLRETSYSVMTGVVSILRNIVNFVFRVARSILQAFAILPGPMGAPFRAAQKALERARKSIMVDLNRIQDRINRLHGKVITISIEQRIRETLVQGFSTSASLLRHRRGRAIGGIIGAFDGMSQGMAAGGVSGARGVLVGEQGPELVSLPYGSKVTPAGQTQTQLEQAGGSRSGGPIHLTVNVGGQQIAQVLVDPLRREVRKLGGDVQVALGTA